MLKIIIKIKILFIVSIALFACGGGGGDSGPVPGRNACDDLQLNAKIIQGTACSSPEESAVIRLVLVDAEGKQAYCSGTVLSPEHILTAGHCFDDDPVRVVAVHGEPLSEAAQYEAAAWTVHPLRQAEGLYIVNDVALVVMAEQVPAPALPILARTTVSKGDLVSIFGYGKDEAGEFDFEELQSGEMKISEIDPRYLRADFTGEGSNTCLGDSGGPLVFVVDGVATLVGVTSTGQRADCLADDQSFFVNIQSPEVLDFIQQVVPEANYY